MPACRWSTRYRRPSRMAPVATVTPRRNSAAREPDCAGCVWGGTGERSGGVLQRRHFERHRRAEVTPRIDGLDLGANRLRVLPPTESDLRIGNGPGLGVYRTCR